MREWKKQTYVTWHCLYHIVFIPKYRKKAIFGRLRQEIGKIFHELCNQFGISRRACATGSYSHVFEHPATVCGISSSRAVERQIRNIDRRYLGKGKNLSGYRFWARSYCVSTVGLDEATVRQYIENKRHMSSNLINIRCR